MPDSVGNAESKHCRLCQRELNQPSIPDTLDCGGDCLRCMALISEDPDCIQTLKEMHVERNKN